MKLMVDSGGHSLFNKYARESRDYSFFETDMFWEYVDSYVDFIIENKHLIDVYVSVDAVFNPEISWKVQKYMESKGLSPMPVYHAGEDLSWLKKYVDNYDYVGLGGLGQRTSKVHWRMGMGDPAFDIVCGGTDTPRVKTHGFAMTSPELIIEYPFYSTDSSSWMQFGKYGLIIIPKKKGNKFVYDESPHILVVSSRKKAKSDERHFDSLPKQEKQHVLEYLEMKGVKFGESVLKEVAFDNTKPELPILTTEVSSEEIIIERGVCNDGEARDQVNLEYYLDLELNLPPWPRKWNKKSKMLTRLPF